MLKITRKDETITPHYHIRLAMDMAMLYLFSILYYQPHLLTSHFFAITGIKSENLYSLVRVELGQIVQNLGET